MRITISATGKPTISAPTIIITNAIMADSKGASARTSLRDISSTPSKPPRPNAVAPRLNDHDCCNQDKIFRICRRAALVRTLTIQDCAQIVNRRLTPAASFDMKPAKARRPDAFNASAAGQRRDEASSSGPISTSAFFSFALQLRARRRWNRIGCGRRLRMLHLWDSRREPSTLSPQERGEGATRCPPRDACAGIGQAERTPRRPAVRGKSSFLRGPPTPSRPASRRPSGAWCPWRRRCGPGRRRRCRPAAR